MVDLTNRVLFDSTAPNKLFQRLGLDTGAGLIGTTGGLTAQQRFDSLASLISSFAEFQEQVADDFQELRDNQFSAQIGLFSQANDDTVIPANCIMLHTTGHTRYNEGRASYILDEDIDPAAFPRCVISIGDKNFRLAESRPTPLMLGARDATGIIKGATEVVYDSSAVLEELWDYCVAYPGTMTPDLSTCRGLGITEPWVLDTGAGGAHWNTFLYNLIGGRLVAMAVSGGR